MDFRLTEDQASVRDAVTRLCARFDDAYWLERDRTGAYPLDFHAAMAAGGWLGIAMPEAVGGAGMGVADAAVLMHTVARSPGAMAACSSIHLNVFGPHAVVVHGTPEQQERMLGPLIRGETKACFGVTEPDAGLDTTSISTRAERTNRGYSIHGKKIWTSSAQVADKILLLARTTPRDRCAKPTDGLSLFFTDLDRDHVDVREIPKMGRAAVDSNELFFDGMPVPADDLIGEEGQGFRYLLHSLNPERILVGLEAVGIGQYAIERAARYACERVVFGRPIGQNQAVAHPLAESWMELEAAYLVAMNAAALYDAGEPCGPQANAAKYLGAEAGFHACERAMLAHGGMGYAKEFHVERLLREVMITRIAPVSREMIKNFIAERVLGLPRSY